MKRLVFNFIIPIIAVIAMAQIASAQPIITQGLYAPNPVVGGARIRMSAGNTAADPAIGFFGNVQFNPNNAASWQDAGGGNGIFRPAANTMAFATSSTERMRINSSGFIGIGTGSATITQKLQLKGGNVLLDYANGVTAGNLFFGGVTTAQNGLKLFFNNPAGTTTSKNGNIEVRSIGGLPNDGLLFRVDGVSGITTERMRITKGGNVGIGISDPKQKLHLAGGMMLSGPTLGFGGPMVLFSESTAANPISRWGIEYVRAATPDESGVNFWIPWDPSNTAPGNHHLFLRDKDGKVGVGVDPNPALYPNAPNGPFPAGYRLYVKEGIMTEKLKIANIYSSQWADYVFAPDYKLKPLSEVEAFVKANKHLPNVPSAQDIENDGLDVADMLARQMEKIEELMLHAIELNKRVVKLEEENAALKQKTGNK